MKHTNKLFAVLVGILLTSFAVPALAQAEQCSPDGKICLVEEFTQANPLMPNQAFHLSVTSEASQLIVSPPSTGGLISQGPSGGMSLWEATLQPSDVQEDGQVNLEVQAYYSSFDHRATFTVPVLAAAANEQVIIKRTKKQVVAIYQFDGRTTLTANVQLWLDQFHSGEIILTHRGVSQTTSPGHQVIKVAIPRSVIKRKCKRYPHCSVLATGRTWSGSYAVDQGTNGRLKVK
jgi:hypothetical protein